MAEDAVRALQQATRALTSAKKQGFQVTPATKVTSSSAPKAKVVTSSSAKLQQRIAETLARKGGKIQGKSQTRQERATSYFKQAARGGKPLQTDHKPRGYRPVPCKNNIRVQQYVRRGNEVVASHCRYK